MSRLMQRLQVGLPRRVDPAVLVVLLAAWVALYAMPFAELARTIWASDEQGHGPIILGLCAVLLWLRRREIADAATAPRPQLGWPLLGFGVLLYAAGGAFDIIMFQAGSQVPLLAALLLLFGGTGSLRAGWFPVFFLLFMVPLPEALVAALTGPLKSAVSAVAAQLLHALGYPVGRSGVVLTVGPYQLLVADACAGLNSIFTLEALGLLYMHLMRYTRVARNVALALLLVPVAFLANVVRVMVLVLVTFHFGDAAGQGFVHDFAGLLLFVVALVGMLVLDRVLALVLPAGREAAR
ncbi:MAG: exosortase B [Rubrivivax sp.]|nr:exosortase B [Rubrivivax sp.]